MSRLNGSPTTAENQSAGWEQEGVLLPRFVIGDHVRWNSEAGLVTGVITQRHTRDFEYKGHVRHCTEQEPQYEIKSDKTEHVAMHKAGALTKIK